MNFYFLALIPLVVGGIIWLFTRKVNWQEWAIGSACGFILAAIFHLVSIHGMTDDKETWSGQITHAKQFSRWQEYYEEAIYRTEYYTVTVSDYSTDSKGRRYRSGSHTETRSRRVFDHWEPRTCWHDEHWECYSDLNTSYGIDKSRYSYFTNKYAMNKPVAGSRTTWSHNSRMIGGDPNDYVCDTSVTHWIEPVTITKSFVNKVKAAPSVFSFITVGTNIPVYNWPSNPNPFVSDRVMGTARKYISTLEWDKLNAYLGARKKINLIIVGFDSGDSMLGQYQRAKWVGGKKNDLVITLGGHDLKKPDWVYVFGWSDTEIVKQDIQSYVKENGLGSTNLLGYISNEVVQNYKIKEWKQFDYLRVEPATCYYYWFLGFLLVTQVGLYWFFLMNEFDKDGKGFMDNEPVKPTGDTFNFRRPNYSSSPTYRLPRKLRRK